MFRGSDPRYWTPAEDALLGTLPDRELGKKLGRTKVAIRNRRHVLGKAAFRKQETEQRIRP